MMVENIRFYICKLGVLDTTVSLGTFGELETFCFLDELDALDALDTIDTLDTFDTLDMLDTLGTLDTLDTLDTSYNLSLPHGILQDFQTFS